MNEVYGAPMSKLCRLVSAESWASPSQPRRSRCGQSVGMDWKFDMAAVRVMCCTAVSNGSENAIEPVSS